MKHLPLLILAGVLLLAAACAPIRPPATPLASPPPTSPPPAPGALATPVLFSRTGGFAGFDDRVTIAADGSYTANRRGQAQTTGRLAPARLAGLAAVLAASGLFEADHRFETPGADQFVYTITYGGHTVVAVDGAIPAPLQPVIDELAALIGG